MNLDAVQNQQNKRRKKDAFIRFENETKIVNIEQFRHSRTTQSLARTKSKKILLVKETEMRVEETADSLNRLLVGVCNWRRATRRQSKR